MHVFLYMHVCIYMYAYTLMYVYKVVFVVYLKRVHYSLCSIALIMFYSINKNVFVGGGEIYEKSRCCIWKDYSS